MTFTSTSPTGPFVEPASRSALRTQGLVKKFGSFKALDRLDLEVARGEIHGLLGPNRAGKSTSIRVPLGLLRANDGTVELRGGLDKARRDELIERFELDPAKRSRQ